jgi:hypothetical protein
MVDGKWSAAVRRDSWVYPLGTLARRVPVSAFWRYHVSFQRKKCRQQIIRLDDESSSVAVRIDEKKQSMLGQSSPIP